MEFDATLKEFFQQQPTSLLLENETLLHLELQSSNDKDMGLRMLEYYTLLWTRYRKPVRQVVVYVGTPRMRMSSLLEMDALRFSFALRDIRECRADDLLASPILGDQVLAILGGTGDPRGVLRSVLERIGKMAPERRERALRYLLRKFGITLEQEVASMSAAVDWLQYPTVREMVKTGEARGVRESLLMVLETRFGALPAWAKQKIK